MPQFKKHYTREEARNLLPMIRQWLDDLEQVRDDLRELDSKISALLRKGDDIGGETVNRYVRGLCNVKQILLRFQNREIQIKDLDRGLIDFPAFVGGNEVFLCWEKGEDDIEFWHDIDSGYAGRERL